MSIINAQSRNIFCPKIKAHKLKPAKRNLYSTIFDFPLEKLGDSRNILSVLSRNFPITCGIFPRFPNPNRDFFFLHDSKHIDDN